MERCLSIHHLKEDDTNRPDVGFVAILTLLNDLRCHVQWRTADSTVSLMQFVESLREAKVSDLNAEVGRHEVHVLEELLLLSFVHSIQKFFVVREVKHNILQFEIAMNYKLLNHVMEARHQHEHDFARHLRFNLEVLQVHEYL